jgi:urease accessory protein
MPRDRGASAGGNRGRRRARDRRAYRSSGPWARQRVAIEAAAGSCVEWLPQETIVYEAARADIRWHARIDPLSRVIAWDIVCLGRTGSGEGFDRGMLRLETRIERDGRLAWLERGRIEPSSPIARSPVGLDGHSVLGTMIVAAPRIDDAWLASCREASPRSGEAAVTRTPGLLIARYRGDSSEAARHYFIDLWKRLRMPVMGREAIEPRIWRT